MRVMFARLSLAFLILAAAPAVALAAEPAGEAIAVSQSASASGSAGARVLDVRGDVFTGDVVKTDASGVAQILFRDNTKLVVGQNSQVTVDSFVFQNKTTAKAFSIDAVRGSFRFITGASAKQAYTIRTPSATIGVRGTEFDLSVNEDGTTNVALFGGSVRVCDKGTPDRHCLVLTGTCSTLVLTPDQKFREVRSYYERTALMNTVFPFAFRQQPLRTDFRVESGSCNIPNINDPGPQPSRPGPPPSPRSEGNEG
jgi:hypothetical protein